MPLDGQWPGDAIAAPFLGTHDREDAPIERLGSRKWDRVDRRPSGNPRLPRADVNTGNEPTSLAGWRGWITSIVSIIAELCSKRIREREMRRLAAGWERLDDRTLEDIGVSRYEIEFGRDAVYWS